MLRLLRSGAQDPSPAVPGTGDPLRGVAFAAAKGDLDAQRTLLVELGSSLLRVVRAILGAQHPDVEDVLQDAMTAVHCALGGYRGECTVRHFACRVAVHTAMNARRRSRRRRSAMPEQPDSEIDELPTGDRSPAEVFAAAERREALRELVCALPLIHSEVLVLHVMLGYTVDEVGKSLNVPINTVRSRLRAALSHLRESFQENGDLVDRVKGIA